MAQADSAVWLPVLPSFRDFGPALIKGAGQSADGAGRETGKVFGGAVAVGMAAAAGAVAAGVGVLLNTGKVFSDLNTNLAVQTGASGAELDRLTDAAKRVGTQVPASFEEIGGAVSAVRASFDGVGDMTEAEFDQATIHATNFAKAFEVDVNRAAQVAGQMLKTGLVSDADQAFDLLTAASQKVPPALREDVLDATDEYGQFFAALGIDGESAMNALVAASDKGVFGIDKTGDAIKEFTIRATDMSKGTGEAYAALGMDQEAMTAALLKGGDEGAAAFQQIIAGLQSMDDPVAQSTAALALFGTPLEDLGVTEIPQFIDALAGGASALGDVEGAAGRMGESLNSGPAAAFEKLKNTVLVTLAPAAEWLMVTLNDAITTATGYVQGFLTTWSGLVPLFQTVGAWIQQNATWLGLLGAVVGTAAAGLGLLFGAIKAVAAAKQAWTAVTTAVRGAQIALNAALAANPIGLIVIALAALVAGLIYAYTQFEWFRTVVDGAWNGIKTAALAAWEGVIRPTFEAFAGFITGTLVPALLGFWQGVVVPAWTGISAIVSAVWVGVIQPALAAFGSFLTGVVGPALLWFWQSVVVPAWSAISTAISAAWTGIIQPILAAYGSILTGVVGPALLWFWQSVVVPAWTAISGAVAAAWNNVIRPALDAFGGWVVNTLAPAIAGFWQNVVEPAWAGISAAVSTAWAIISTVFGFLMDGLRVVGDALSGLYAGWQTLWSQIQTATSTAVEAVVGFVVGLKDRVVQWFSDLKSRTESIVSDLWERVKSLFSGGVDRVKEFVSDFVNRVVGFFTDLKDKTTAKARDAIDEVKQRFSDGLADLRRTVEDKIDEVVGFFRDLPGRVKEALGDVGNFLKDSGRALLDGFKEGIEGAFNGVRDSVEGGLGRIRDLFPFSPAKRGPFSGRGYTTYSGRALSRDFADAIAGEAGYLADKAEDFVSAAAFDLEPTITPGALAAMQAGAAASSGRVSVGGVPEAGAGFPQELTLVLEDGAAFPAYLAGRMDARLRHHVDGLAQPLRQYAGAS